MASSQPFGCGLWPLHALVRGDGSTWTSANYCFQCIAYFAVLTNLVNYLKDRLHEGSKAAANGVTNWLGTSSITPLVAAFLADAFLGRYWTIALFMVISVVVRRPPLRAVQHGAELQSMLTHPASSPFSRSVSGTYARRPTWCSR
jgi:hypothetical protein